MMPKAQEYEHVQENLKEGHRVEAVCLPPFSR
jgi:hypothetical protein